MKIELCRADVVLDTEENFVELSDNVYQRGSDGAVMILDADQAVLIEKDEE